MSRANRKLLWFKGLRSRRWGAIVGAFLGVSSGSHGPVFPKGRFLVDSGAVAIRESAINWPNLNQLPIFAPESTPFAGGWGDTGINNPIPGDASIDCEVELPDTIMHFVPMVCATISRTLAG